MRICLYTETALPKVGGQEMVVDALARQYQALGHDVSVLAPYPRRPLRARDDALPYPVQRHPRFFSTRFLVPWYRWWLLGHHRRRPFDVLHCHGLYPSGYLASLCKSRLGVPIVVTSHGGDVQRNNGRLARPVLRRRHVDALASADRLVAISRFTEEGYRWLWPQAQDIVAIPNGVEVERFATPLPLPEVLRDLVRLKQYFLFLGRLKHRKGIDVLLDALARQEPTRSLPLVIVGAGEENVALEKQCRGANLQSRVLFLGHLEHPVKSALLQHAFCTIVPSRGWESFGLVVLESHAAGTPVIVSSLPGLQDLVRHGETGLIVPPENAAALARAMNLLVQNPRSAAAMGERGREVSQGFAWEAVARRHLELYEELLRPVACGSPLNVSGSRR